MKQGSSVARGAVVAVVAAALATGGCSWFRGKSGYENSPESRPLEIPPDLDPPPADPAMQLPDVSSAPQAPAASTGAPAPSSAPRAAAAADVRLADTVDSTWRRLGLALERIEGVEVTQRAELLSAYSVRYRDSEFLLRVTPDGEGARIAAVDGEGREMSGGAAAELLGQLAQRLR